MTKKGLYMLSVVACAAGYVWLAASSMHAEEGVWRGCLFKQFFHIPCPACGSTRALIALCQGHWKESLPEWCLTGSIDVAGSWVDFIGYH